MSTQIQFNDFLETLGKALDEADARNANPVEVALRLKPNNEFAVAYGDQRTTWQIAMPPNVSDPSWTIYSLLTNVLSFGDDVYNTFTEALRGDRHGWIVLILTPDGVSAERRDAF